jgi:hypothetical protein
MLGKYDPLVVLVGILQGYYELPYALEAAAGLHFQHHVIFGHTLCHLDCHVSLLKI